MGASFAESTNARSTCSHFFLYCLTSYTPPMAFYYRKSVNLGPFRVNLSKSGVGYSVGGRGFRVGTTARGKKYTSFSIPGTGVGYRKSGAGCLVLLAAVPFGITATKLLLTS
jgi:hypothetical protein